MKQQNEGSLSISILFGSLVKGIIITAIFFIFCLFFFSFMMSSAKLSLSYVNVMAIVIECLSSSLMGFITLKGIGRAGVPIGMLSGCVMFALLLLIGFLAYGSLLPNSMINLAITAVCGALGGILGVRRFAKR